MTVSVVIADRDIPVLEEMRERGHFRSHGAVIRTALWHYARHLDIDVTHDYFERDEPQPSLFDTEVRS